jgi:electron-transferring-flavoprotein dehydrogenase
MPMDASVERERLEVDVLFVGAGAACLASAIRLADLCAEQGVDMPEIMVIEKAPEIGGHQLSGAVIDPRGIKELMPDFMEKGFPLQYEVTSEYVYFLTKNRSFRLPPPPPMANHGNLVVSLSEMVKWLGEKAEERGIAVYPGFPASQVLFEGSRVAGVQIQDRGIDRDGKQKSVFEPGPIIVAKVVVFGEGPRGSCVKQVAQELGLSGMNPQAYETGCKEIWRVKPENHMPGRVIHTMGWPHDPATFGGSWLYDMKDNLVSIGFVTGLNYQNPYTDPHDNLQRFKLHPLMRKILEGGECIRYGAKTLPAGGLYSIPPLYADGMMLIGDSAGFCNAGRLKGVHMAIKSGMLAAEALLEGARTKDWSTQTLKLYQEGFEKSWAYQEHREYRNFHQPFDWAQKMPRWLGWARQLPWMANIGAIAPITGGRGLVDPMHSHADHTHVKKLAQVDPGELQAKKQKVAYDNKYTFDKVTAVALAGSRHEVDQPHHLKVITDVCSTRCTEEYGNPCEHFCPAAVYEMIEDDAQPGRKKLLIHHENCVHCKTCDVADPYQVITWTTPEGGEGPDYTQM